MNLISFLVLFIGLETGLGDRPEAIQILDTQDGPSGSRVLHYKGGSKIRDILTADDVKDLPILVYSVTGKTRGGKSFLLNLMHKYLNAEGQSHWTEGTIPNAFDFSDGTDSWTKGLWLSTKVFKRTTLNGTKVGIMLMDNQGLFDGEVTEGESVAMSGVSTILSYIQMFNMNQKITTNDLEQIMIHLVPENVGDHSNIYTGIGSSLMFVVRDFMGKKSYGFGLGNGRKYIADEQNRGTKQYQSMWAEQRSLFNDVDCVLLPHPGLAVMEEEFTQSPNLQVLNGQFVSEINAFLQELFAPENLTPHKGGMTGQRMQDILTKADGKVADNSLSYYNMYLERINVFLMRTAVDNFTQCLEKPEELHRAREYMNGTLATTKFKGESAIVYTSNLRKALEEIINPKVTKYLVNMYKSATTGNDMTKRHKTIWPRVVSGFALLVGSKLEVDFGKEQIVKEIGTIYYKVLAEEEETKFKTFCDKSNSEDFYDRILALNNFKNFNTLLESSIKTCADFTATGASASMLEEIRHKQRFYLNSTITNNILKNIYKVDNYFVQRYNKLIKKKNVEVDNSILWSQLKRDIDRIEFVSKTEKPNHIKSIAKEISATYYKLLREEIYLKLKAEWNALNNTAFHEKYVMYMDKSNLQRMVLEVFHEYSDFRSEGLTDPWKVEKDILENGVRRLIIENMYKEKQYLIQQYSILLKKYNVEVVNSILWPQIQGDINRLEFETASDKINYTQTFAKEISAIYYKQLREEMYLKLKTEWSALNNSDFSEMCEMYMDKNNLTVMILHIFKEYSEFRSIGLTDVWKVEKDVLEKDVLLLIYEMDIDRSNIRIMQAAVTNLTARMDDPEELYRAKEYMNVTLTTTKFRGQSAVEFKSQLRKKLDDMVNAKVTNYLVDMYEYGSKKGNDIMRYQKTIWPKIENDFSLLVGSKLEVDVNKEKIVKKIATVYYTTLALEHDHQFRIFCEMADSEVFYERMIALNNSQSLSMFLDTSVKMCGDFVTTGVSVVVLNEIREKAQTLFAATVQKNILRNMYKVEKYFVDRYNRIMENNNVELHNSVLWPKLKRDIDGLVFESESEKFNVTHSITKKISEIYYKLLRNEEYFKLKAEWGALNNSEFYAIHKLYWNETNLKSMAIERFPEYSDFRNEGLTDVWESNKYIFEMDVKYLIQKSIEDRGWSYSLQILLYNLINNKI